MDCWNRIGVRGDSSCPELERYVHCRNCPVHAAGAIALLERAPEDDYVATWTRHVATMEAAADRGAESIVIFRVGAEWLALPTAVVGEVTRMLSIHSLPHRRRDIVLGVANFRGTLTACLSLERVLGVEPSSSPGQPGQRGERQRLLVLNREGLCVVCPVDEVHGVHHVHPRDLRDVPATLAKATTRYSTQLLPWQGRSVGILDAPTLFASLKRSLA